MSTTDQLEAERRAVTLAIYGEDKGQVDEYANECHSTRQRYERMADVAIEASALPLRSAQVEAVLALHQREIRWQIDSYPELSFETFADAEDMADGPDEQFSNFELCVECKRIEDGPSGVNSKDVGYESALYPCATVRAIEEAGK